MQIHVLMEKVYKYNDSTYSENGAVVVAAYLDKEVAEREAAQRNKEWVDYLFDSEEFLSYNEGGEFEKGFAKALERKKQELIEEGETPEVAAAEIRRITREWDCESLFPLTDEEKQEVIAEYEPQCFYLGTTELTMSYHDAICTLLEKSDGKHVAA